MRLLSLLFILLSLGACGLKGDLVIPEPQSAEQPAEQSAKQNQQNQQTEQ